MVSQPSLPIAERGIDSSDSNLDSRDALLWSEAVAADDAGELAGAARAFRELARRRPDWPEPAFRLCLADLKRGAADGNSPLQALLARFPHYAPGWESIGRFMLSAGKPEAALVCFRRVEGAGDGASSLLVGLALRALGRTREARRAFATACAHDPASVRAQFLQALCAQDMADWPAAAAGYRAALARDPDLVEALVNLGIVLQVMGDLADAKQAYRKALRRRADSFGRISQALTTMPRGELWLDLGQLRRHLAG